MGPQPFKQVLVHLHMNGDRIEKVEFKQYAVDNRGGFCVVPEHQRKHAWIFETVHSMACQMLKTEEIHYHVIGNTAYQLLRDHLVYVTDLRRLGCHLSITVENPLAKMEDWIQRQGWDEVD